MKKLYFLLISALILKSCTETTDPPAGPPANVPNQSSTPTVKQPTDPAEIEPEPQVTSTYITTKAKYIDFNLGDATHYSFEDEEGKSWEFNGHESTDFEFAIELDVDEINETNQGWGPNKELLNKWFELTVEKREQQLYIDGPTTTALVIVKATQIKK